jgi:ubiquitin-like protein ATG12
MCIQWTTHCVIDWQKRWNETKWQSLVAWHHYEMMIPSAGHYSVHTSTLAALPPIMSDSTSANIDSSISPNVSSDASADNSTSLSVRPSSNSLPINSSSEPILSNARPTSQTVVLQGNSEPVNNNNPSSAASLRNIPLGLKVIIHFRATGEAPILKKSKFQLSAHYKFHVVIEFLRKHLHSKPSDSLFLFCNASFSPSPDAVIYDLFQCFQLNNELIINYAMQDAWSVDVNIY